MGVSFLGWLYGYDYNFLNLELIDIFFFRNGAGGYQSTCNQGASINLGQRDETLMTNTGFIRGSFVSTPAKKNIDMAQ